MMVLPSVVVAYLFSYNIASFQSLTLCSTLVIAVTYLGTTVAAIVLPYLAAFRRRRGKDRLRKEDEKILIEMEKKFFGKLTFRADPAFHAEQFKILNAVTNEELASMGG